MKYNIDDLIAQFDNIEKINDNIEKINDNIEIIDYNIDLNNDTYLNNIEELYKLFIFYNLLDIYYKNLKFKDVNIMNYYEVD